MSLFLIFFSTSLVIDSDMCTQVRKNLDEWDGDVWPHTIPNIRTIGEVVQCRVVGESYFKVAAGRGPEAAESSLMRNFWHPVTNSGDNVLNVWKVGAVVPCPLLLCCCMTDILLHIWLHSEWSKKSMVHDNFLSFLVGCELRWAPYRAQTFPSRYLCEQRPISCPPS